MGMLCKKPIYRKPIIKVAKTVYPEGEPRMSPNGSGEWYGLVEDKKESKGIGLRG